jgi:hypothetical protein
MTNSASVERGRVRARLALLALSTALCTGLAAPALAQTEPLHRNLDANGVDLTLGDFVMSFKEGSIGSGDAELPLIRQGYGDYPSQWDGYSFTKKKSGAITTIVIGLPGQRWDRFTDAGGASLYSSVTGNGATLIPGSLGSSGVSYTYQTSDGTKVDFTDPTLSDGLHTNLCTLPSIPSVCSMIPTSITDPSGANVALLYSLFKDPSNNFFWRLFRVSNSYGYKINFGYQTNTISPGAPMPPAGWLTRTSAKFYNNNVSPTVPQASVSYAYPASGTVDITDMAGNVGKSPVRASNAQVRRAQALV